MNDTYVCGKCDGPAWRLIRGYLCDKCYTQMQKSPDWKPLRRPTARERLLSHLIIDPSGCLLWDGATTKDGYGTINVRNRTKRVHVFMWELLEGPVPVGLELDHVKANGCTNRHCANIAHLEPVTHRENNSRGTSPSAECARKTHCKEGHEFTPSNTHIRPSGGGRLCRKCLQAENVRRRAEAKALRDAGAVLLAALFAIRAAWADGHRHGRREGVANAKLDAVLATSTLDGHFGEALLSGALHEPVGEEMASLLAAVQEHERAATQEVTS